MTPEQEFVKMLLDSGLTAWHNAGYKGQGVKVLSCQDENTTHGAGRCNADNYDQRLERA